MQGAHTQPPVSPSRCLCLPDMDTQHRASTDLPHKQAQRTPGRPNAHAGAAPPTAPPLWKHPGAATAALQQAAAETPIAPRSHKLVRASLQAASTQCMRHHKQGCCLHALAHTQKSQAAQKYTAADTARRWLPPESHAPHPRPTGRADVPGR
jgi:hypothetical protein